MSDFNGIVFDTRQTSKSRRRLGKGKRASVDEDSSSTNVTDLHVQRKSRRNDSNDESYHTVGTMAILPGIDKCFVGARKGTKGLRRALKKYRGRVSFVPTPLEVDTFKKEILHLDPTSKDILELTQRYLDMNALGWLWQMQQDFNVLLFGVGCKRDLLRRFSDEFLHGHQVLMINGNCNNLASNNRVIAALLDKITSSVLKFNDSSNNYINIESYVRKVCDGLDDHYSREILKDKSDLLDHDADSITGDQNDEDLRVIHQQSDLEASNSQRKESMNTLALNSSRPTSQPSSSALSKLYSITGQKNRERQSHKQSKLYILVNSIDGESLRSDDSQLCLSLLAACSSISIIATADNLNTPILWNPLMLSNFRWINSHVPTYRDYVVDTLKDLNSIRGKNDVLSGTKALEYIYKSLTKRHDELIALLASDALKQHETGMKKPTKEKEKPAKTANIVESTLVAHYLGISMEDLLVETTKKIIARSTAELNVLLKELVDHKLVTKEIDSSRRYRIMIMLPIEELRRAVSRRKN